MALEGHGFVLKEGGQEGAGNLQSSWSRNSCHSYNSDGRLSGTARIATGYPQWAF